MIKKKIELLRSKFKEHKIDGYIIPKNDEFFSAYSKNDRLKTISNFSGSAGYAIVLKNKNYLFVDGRYTLQANIESGKNFKISDFEKIFNCTLFKNLNLGLDPKLFTSYQIKNFFLKYNKIKFINKNLIDEIHGNYKTVDKPFYSLNEKIVGESSKTKILKIKNILNKVKSNYLFISAPENIAWLLNIRGFDNPFSPIPNCRLLISKKAIFIICEKKKLKKLIKLKKIKKKEIIDPKEFDSFFKNISGNKIIIDKNTCSVHYENILNKNFKTIIKDDPIYFLKSIKNKTEIKNMINAHISDGVALTKFIFWIKNINKKKITEVDAQNKLESLRKLNDKYLFPSFNTIAGSGKNGAIVHYRATKKILSLLKKMKFFYVTLVVNINMELQM